MRLPLALCLAVIPASSMADESSFEVMLGNGAMICDQADSVVTSLAQGTLMPDCGIFRTRTGAPVTVTIIGNYEDKPLARFEFHIAPPWGNQVQYGWWAGEIPAVVIPGIDA